MSEASVGGSDRAAKNAVPADAAAKQNVRKAMSNIRQNSPILRQMEKKGQIQIVGGMHDITTGKVTFFN